MGLEWLARRAEWKISMSSRRVIYATSWSSSMMIVPMIGRVCFGVFCVPLCFVDLPGWLAGWLDDRQTDRYGRSNMTKGQNMPCNTSV